MNELESLASKSDADLAQIAVAFGDFTEAEAATKSREELIQAISGKTGEAPAEAEAKPAPKKRGRKKKVEEAPAEEVKETAEVTEAAEVKPAPKKRGRKKKVEETPIEEAVKAEEAKAAVEATEAPKEAEAAEGAEAEAENKPAKRKPIKSKKRKLSFGPGQDIKQIETDEANPEAPAEEEIPEQPIEIEVEGVLSIGNPDSNRNDFCGFVHRHNYLPGEEDAYVPGQMIKRMGLRRGDYIKGFVAPKRGKDKYAPLRRVVSVNGIEVQEDNYDAIRKRPKFESLTAIYPDERLTLETEKEDISPRIIDLFSPIGKGQRGMIVSPPKAGKTILLQKVANSITANNPNCVLIVLLIDERPEEVTDMQRNIKGEVVYSTFDKRPENHVRVTELVLERAMRLVELGKDVVILLDSMTRLARAYNLTINPTGRTLSGGLDPGSLYGPKRFFGAARNIEHGGSLTILATALIETGSRMDEVIFEEFKGTGNMEVTLDRKLADRRVFPAIAVDKSGTRREDLLLSQEELDAVWLIRRRIADADTISATNAVINFMEKTSSNRSFILSVKKSFATD